MIWPGRETWSGPLFAFEGGQLVGFICRSVDPVMFLLAIKEGEGYRDRTCVAQTCAQAKTEFERWFEFEKQILAGKERENGEAIAQRESAPQTIQS